MKPLSYEQALNRAASLCSSSEHCTGEMNEKLRKWGLTEAESAKAIAYLVNERYIDDERFCRAYANDKFRYSHWGRIKISQMLRHLGLSDPDIEEGLSVIDEEAYAEAIRQALSQKARTLNDEDPYQRKGKLVRHLLSRGFEMSLVLDMVDDIV